MPVPAGRSAPVPVPAAGLSAAVPVAPGPDVTAVLANVALVDRVIGACGGPENASQAAEAVRACGGVDAFLQLLATVAAIRRDTPPA